MHLLVFLSYLIAQYTVMNNLKCIITECECYTKECVYYFVNNFKMKPFRNGQVVILYLRNK